MEKTKIENEESANDSKAADDVGSENSQKKATGRRLKDSIVSKDPLRKLNLDRRAENSDRRIANNPNYNGPARRNTIDRRLNLKDRREKD